MDSVFASLGCGIRFDRKRHGEEIDLFRVPRESLVIFDLIFTCIYLYSKRRRAPIMQVGSARPAPCLWWIFSINMAAPTTLPRIMTNHRTKLYRKARSSYPNKETMPSKRMENLRWRKRRIWKNKVREGIRTCLSLILLVVELEDDSDFPNDEMVSFRSLLDLDVPILIAMRSLTLPPCHRYHRDTATYR